VARSSAAHQRCDGRNGTLEEQAPMIRRAFTMRLKPGMLDEYRRMHQQVWPELVQEIARSGIVSMTIFENYPLLFVFSEILDEAAWDKLWKSDVHHRWVEIMRPLLELRDDGIIDASELNEVYHLRTSPEST
jgi:L-rhamnose mutarotase